MQRLLVQQNMSFLQRYKTQQTKLVVVFSKPKKQKAPWLAFIDHPEEGFPYQTRQRKWMRLQWRINKKGQMPQSKRNTSKRPQTVQNLSFHLLKDKQGLALGLLGNKPVATSGASHLHSILPSPLSSNLSTWISAVLLAWNAIWPPLVTLVERWKTGLKSGWTI